MSIFPNIEWTGSGSQTSDTTTHVITVPSTINVDDAVLVFFTMHDNAGASSITSRSDGGGLIYRTSSSYNNLAGLPNLGYYYFNASIANSGSLILYSNVAEKSSHITYRISGTTEYGAHDVTGDGIQDTIRSVFNAPGTSSTNADPPTINTDITGTLGEQDFLFFVVSGFLGTVVASAAPTDFSGLTNVTNSGADGVSLSTAYRQYRSSGNYNPGTFTSVDTNWITLTLSISPKFGSYMPFYRKSII